MALRLIEIILQAKDSLELHTLFKEHTVLEHRQLCFPNAEVLERILLDAERYEAVLDLPGRRYTGAKGNRVVAMLLLKEVGGALVLALAAGFITYQMLKRVDNYQVEVLLTLALAMGLYALADALHLSARWLSVATIIEPLSRVTARSDGGASAVYRTLTALSTQARTRFWFIVNPPAVTVSGECSITHRAARGKR